MTATAFLMGLLALSFLGSILVGRKGTGLASGVEFVGLGILAGPFVLGWISRSTIDSFSPVVHAALGWLAFVIGLDFGRFSGVRHSRTVALASLAAAAFTLGSVSLAVWFTLDRSNVSFPRTRDSLVLALACGVVATETTRHAVKWAIARFRAHGPVTDLFAQIASSDDLVPLVALVGVSLLLPGSEPVPVSTWGLALATVLIGVFFAAIAAILLKNAEGDEVWAILIGTVLLTVGVTLRLGLATLSTAFVFGVALRTFTTHKRAVRVLVTPTERPVLLPLLLVAGARLDVAPLFATPRLVFALIAALTVRVVAKVAIGFFARARGTNHPMFGAGLLSSGALSIACGLFIALRAPGILGDTVLVLAVAVAMFGEMVAPFAARRALEDAGELTRDPIPSDGIDPEGAK